MPIFILKMTLTICMALTFVFSGCSHMKNSAKTPSASTRPPVAEKKYSREIVELKKEINRLSEEIAQVQIELEKSNEEKLAIKRTNHKLAREEIKLREKNRELAESNLKLQKTIEMLKNLDRRLEEKRRNFSN